MHRLIRFGFFRSRIPVVLASVLQLALFQLVGVGPSSALDTGYWTAKGSGTTGSVCVPFGVAGCDDEDGCCVSNVPVSWGCGGPLEQGESGIHGRACCGPCCGTVSASISGNTISGAYTCAIGGGSGGGASGDSGVVYKGGWSASVTVPVYGSVSASGDMVLRRTQTPGSCGDGERDPNEQCDDGNNISGDCCSAYCISEPECSTCGDGVLDPGELCDDGIDPLGCTDCVPNTCGDSTVDPGEECDDGNNADRDGCAADCRVEPRYSCTPPPGPGPSVCTRPMDVCGDGWIDPPEGCDDKSTQPGDGCSSTCAVEPGWECFSEPSICQELEYCGNGIVEGVEECDDNNALDGDCCDSECFVEPVDQSCDDGNFCTAIDTCDGAGSCVGAGDPCPGPDGDFDCVESCDEVTDSCTAPDPDGSVCDDGLFCTLLDTCGSGVCFGAGDPCPGGVECQETCDEGADACQDPFGLACSSDGNLCTDDVCDGAGACSHPANSDPCNDGNACTTVDTCSGGSCQGSVPLVCDDGELCTNDSCAPGSGCVFTNNTVPCNDGNACTTVDACSGGSCLGSVPLVCNDGEICTDDSCAPGSGCVFSNNIDPCDDGDACTSGETCGGGACQAGAPIPGCEGGGCAPDVSLSYAKITASDTTEPQARFGGAVVGVDLDMNGVVDLAVGDKGDNAVWLVYRNPDGTVLDSQKLAGTSVDSAIAAGDRFGDSVESIGDLDGNGFADLAVGGSTAGSGAPGAVWIVFLGVNGSVQDFVKIADGVGGFGGGATARFGHCLAFLGDLNQDGDPELGVGAIGANSSQGRLWVLTLNGTGPAQDLGEVVWQTEIDSDDLPLSNGDQFGTSCRGIGDIDGDLIPDVVVGANEVDGSGLDRGAVWVLRLNSAGAVKPDGSTRIGDLEGGFDGVLSDGDKFGSSVTPIGDIDGDGTTELVVGAPFDGGRGAAWLLFLSAAGVSQCNDKVSGEMAGLSVPLESGDLFGSGAGGVSASSGAWTFAMGATGDDDASTNGGALWMLTLSEPLCTPTSCDDGNPCTDDSCDPGTGCSHVANVDPCDDADACTTGDTCSGGTCQGGAPLVCDDSEVCTDDSCDAGTGCVFANNTAPCDDADACTTADTCSGGTCQGGLPLTCDDSEVCTDDSCDPGVGCVFTNNTSSCDDADACTTLDVCSGGTCLGGAPLLCDDGEICTDDSCNPGTGCVFANNASPCDDGEFCNGSDTCSGGVCAHSGDPCVGGNECADQCDEIADDCLDPFLTACGGAAPCTTSGICDGAGLCVGEGPVSCGDASLCTIDSCNPIGGTCENAPIFSCTEGGGTVPIGTGQDVEGSFPPGIGSQVAGGVDVSFADVSGAGTLSVNVVVLPIAEIGELQQSLGFGDIAFTAISDPMFFWDLSFDGSFSAPISLTFGYDEADIVPGLDEFDLAVYHFEGGSWQMLGGMIDEVGNTITVDSPSLSPFVLGRHPAAPGLPALGRRGVAALVVLVAALAIIVSLRRRPFHSASSG